MKDYTEIKNIDDFKSLLIRAENGNTKAMNEVSIYYENGLTYENVEIVKSDPKIAFNWTKKSYEYGDIEATEIYADYLTNEYYQFCDKNIELAMKLYEKAMNGGSGDATFKLGQVYTNKQQFEKAFELYQKAEKLENNYCAEFTVALCHLYGIGTNKDILKALELFKSISQLSNSHFDYEIDEANYLIGKLYLEGVIVEQSLELARHYLELADKDKDHRSAQELLIIIGRTKYIN